MPLDNRFAGDLILVVHLDTGRFAVIFLVAGDDFKIRALRSSPRGIFRVTEVTGPPNIPHLPDILSGRQPVNNLNRLQLAHAKTEQVSLCIHQNARVYRIIPVVIMGKPPQGCFQAANDDRHIRAVNPAYCLCVYCQRPIGTLPWLSAGGISVVVAPGEGDRIMGNH